MSSSIKVIGVDQSSLSEALLRSWAEMYCQIWKEPPWNEDFWKVSEVENDIRSQLAKPGSVACLAVTESGEVVGFTNGYLVNQDELSRISASERFRHLFTDGESAFYLDELGVASAYRCRGIGHSLTRSLLDSLKATAVSGRKIFLRTDIGAHKARALYRSLSFEDLGIPDGKHHTRTYWMLAI